MPRLIADEQLTFAPHGHVLTNCHVWSPDGLWIAYDVRSDAAGAVFDGTRIEQVRVTDQAIRVLFESRHGACCGAATCNPRDNRVVFIHGPEFPTAGDGYSAWRRHGAVVSMDAPGVATHLDARNVVSPYTPGALRGGTHVHVFSDDGQWVSFTYEDAVLANPPRVGADADLNQRNVGVCAPLPVVVPAIHSGNHSGTHFSVLATRTVNAPCPGSNDIDRAIEDAWIGTRGYRRADGGWQHRAVAFQGQVTDVDGRQHWEVFVVDLPDDITQAGEDGPLEGTATRRPTPPRGTSQRRLTFTADRRYPGLQGSRHWLRSSPDGEQIGFLMRDDAGVAQLWTVSPRGGPPRQVTQNPSEVASAFTWSGDGRWIAHVMDGSVCLTEATTGVTHRLTERFLEDDAPRPEACVFAPDGRRIAYVRRATSVGERWNQVFCVTFDPDAD